MKEKIIQLIISRTEKRFDIKFKKQPLSYIIADDDLDEIVKLFTDIIEAEPTDFPVRESDEFDEGGRMFKQALLGKFKIK